VTDEIHRRDFIKLTAAGALGSSLRWPLVPLPHSTDAPCAASNAHTSATTKLRDVNPTSLTDAITLGCHAIGNAFDASDNDTPYFLAFARPRPFFGFSRLFSDANVPGVKLLGLLNAERALGTPIGEEAFEKLRKTVYFSLSGPVGLPLNRETKSGPLVNFGAFNLHAALGALNALIAFRGEERAHAAAERCIAAMLDLWKPETGWDAARLKQAYGVVLIENGGGTPTIQRSVPLFPGIGGSIGALANYYATTRSPAAWRLVSILRDIVVSEYLNERGDYDPARMGPSSRWAIRIMQVLSQVASATQDADLMARVKRLYANGVKQLTNEFGWSTEPIERYTLDTDGAPSEIVESALRFASATGDAGCYQHAEQVLRGRLLPSQLRDVSWIAPSPASPDRDEDRDVAQRLKGSWGFPAPYGHKAVNDTVWGNRVPFLQDVVGFVVTSLSAALENATEYARGEHRINLLFDRTTDAIVVHSPYTGDGLRFELKRPGPVLVRLPPWINRDKLQIAGGVALSRLENGYLRLTPQRREVVLRFPLTQRQTELPYRGETVRVRLKGDQVTQMDNFGADLTFFDAFE
jgi:hypothetical protein